MQPFSAFRMICSRFLWNSDPINLLIRLRRSNQDTAKQIAPGILFAFHDSRKRTMSERPLDRPGIKPSMPTAKGPDTRVPMIEQNNRQKTNTRTTGSHQRPSNQRNRTQNRPKTDWEPNDWEICPAGAPPSKAPKQRNFSRNAAKKV